MSIMTDIRAFVLVCRLNFSFLQNFYLFPLPNVILKALVLLLQPDHFGDKKRNFFFFKFIYKNNIETNKLLLCLDHWTTKRESKKKSRRNKSDTKLKINQKSVFLSTRCNELLRLPRSTYPSKYSHNIIFLVCFVLFCFDFRLFFISFLYFFWQLFYGRAIASGHSPIKDHMHIVACAMD